MVEKELFWRYGMALGHQTDLKRYFNSEFNIFLSKRITSDARKPACMNACRLSCLPSCISLELAPDFNLFVSLDNIGFLNVVVVGDA